MKLSLLGTAGCLDRAARAVLGSGGYCVFSANRIREVIHRQERISAADSRRVDDIFVFDCRSGCSRSL